ncbi:MAG TPA: flagellar hook-associated protein FlgK [Anaeromyxobacteraceae bacterium]|nr:flagellar hook-associated protein FlgK [Anaeromyxobacteraceae bacterium]
MATILSILSSAGTSLAALQEVITVASNNINNSNTPGYSRQTAVLTDLAPTDQVGGVVVGGGATVTTVTQARDRFLEAQIPQALAQAAQSTAESNALSSLQTFDTATTSSTGSGTSTGGALATAISSFYSSLSAASQNPSDPSLRAAALGAAQALAQAFNSTSEDIASNRSGLDTQASGLVGQINTEAAAVAELNGEIQQASAGGTPPNDLLDLRQTHLDNLATLTGGTPITTSQGYVNVMLPGGLALVAGTSAGSLSTEPDPANGGHLGIVLTQPGGSGTAAIAASGLGGTLGGTLSARDGALATAAASVDQLASDLSTQLNTANEAGYGLDGSAGAALFNTGATVSGAAGAMTLAITNPSGLAFATTSGDTGDATNAQALVATQTATLTGGEDVEGTLSAITSQYGSAASAAQALAAQDSAMSSNLQTQRASYSGVSTDDELITLQGAQRSYEAISKVITTADTMMDYLLSMTNITT